MAGMKKKYIFDEKDSKEIENMSGMGMRTSDIAQIKGMSLATIKRIYQDELTRGKKYGRFELLKTAHYLATKGKNCAMLIFLLKTRCGLKDNFSMTLKEKRPPDVKRVALPNDPLLAAKAYREIILKQ